jgi:hypothetical protein
MVIASGKHNFVAPGKRFSTPMSSPLGLSDFDPKINREHIGSMGKLYELYSDSRGKE